MRQRGLSAGFGMVFAVALIVGGLALSTGAQQDTDYVLFPTSSATITLTDSGISINPEQLNPGPVVFTIQNDSGLARGVFVRGLDSTGTPILRYSMLVGPGSSTTMNFWHYQGSTYTFSDFTSSRIEDDHLVFDSMHSTSVTIPTLIPIGRGPAFEQQTATITITDSAVSVTPSVSDAGPVLFTVVNNSSVRRGVLIKGLDRAGSPIFRYSRLISPGDSLMMNFFLYGGQTYTIRDYATRVFVGGTSGYTSSFSTTLTVNAMKIPAAVEVEPSMTPPAGVEAEPSMMSPPEGSEEVPVY